MQKKSGSSLFLMELIMSILIFSLASTVCIQLFVKSHLVSSHSTSLNQSILWCQNLAEGFLGCNGDVSEVCNLYPEAAVATDTEINLYFDRDWHLLNSNQSDDAAFRVQLCILPPDASADHSSEAIGSLKNAQITSVDLGKEGSVIYQLPLTKFVGREDKS